MWRASTRRSRWWATTYNPVSGGSRDGEPGERANWVLTQAGHFLDNDSLDVVDGRARVRPGTRVTIPEIDYHTTAHESYQVFAQARADGVLAPESRFLVSIPTPFNAVNSFVSSTPRSRLPSPTKIG